MLMAIRFPDHFMIAAVPGIQIGNTSEIPQIGFHSAGMIAAPGDFRAGVDGQAQDGKAMRANLFGEANYSWAKAVP